MRTFIAIRRSNVVFGNRQDRVAVIASNRADHRAAQHLTLLHDGRYGDCSRGLIKRRDERSAGAARMPAMCGRPATWLCQRPERPCRPTQGD